MYSLILDSNSTDKKRKRDDDDVVEKDEIVCYFSLIV